MTGIRKSPSAGQDQLPDADEICNLYYNTQGRRSIRDTAYRLPVDYPSSPPQGIRPSLPGGFSTPTMAKASSNPFSNHHYDDYDPDNQYEDFQYGRSVNQPRQATRPTALAASHHPQPHPDSNVEDPEVPQKNPPLVKKKTKPSIKRRLLEWRDPREIWRARRRLLLTILAVLAGTLVALLTFLLWPRPVSLVFDADLTRDRFQEESIDLALFSIFTIDNQVFLNISGNVMANVRNENYVSVSLKGSLKGTWVMSDGSKRDFGTGTLDRVKFPIRYSGPMAIPFVIDYGGDPLRDAIFLDYYRRCAAGGGSEGNLVIEYELDSWFTVVGRKRPIKVASFTQSYPCPMDEGQVVEILKAARIDAGKLPDDIRKRLAPLLEKPTPASNDQEGGKNTKSAPMRINPNVEGEENDKQDNNNHYDEEEQT